MLPPKMGEGVLGSRTGGVHTFSASASAGGSARTTSRLPAGPRTATGAFGAREGATLQEAIRRLEDVKVAAIVREFGRPRRQNEQQTENFPSASPLLEIKTKITG